MVTVIMGSKSDWDVMKHCCETLTQFGVPHEKRVLSAHRTPHATAEFISGVAAAHTILPVLGVPMESASLKGMDSLLSTVQMPGGIPVGTLAIGKPGATNAALLAVAILATNDAALRDKLRAFREEQSKKVLAETL
jgi:5-(carboxyamino)imidazole ribonucleotide mutase